MDKNRLLYLLERNQEGLISGDEAKELQQWYDSPASQHGFTDSLSDQARIALEEKMFAKIRLNSNSNPVLIKSRRPFARVFGVAAAVILFMMAGLGYYWYRENAGITVIRTAFGETRKVILPDGSEVILNGNSELYYEAGWSGFREVELEGEAYFKIVHTSDHRNFRVSTGSDFSLDVLGTQFNVSKRKSGTRVVLDEGKVRCNLGGSGRDTLVLKPGEMVRFRQKPSDYQLERVETGLYSAWKDHKLVFKNTSLREVAAILQDTYGLETEASQSELLDRRISGSVPTDNVDLLLQGIAEASAVTITRDGDQLVVAPKSQ